MEIGKRFYYYVLLVELVSKRQPCLTRILFGAYAIHQLPICCLDDMVHHLLCAAAASFMRFRPPMSRVLFQIQDCNTPSLPEDVLIDILLMLPVKTLLRFKAVCKTWNAIISSSYFVDQHSRREGNHTHLLVCWSGISEFRRPNPYDYYDDHDAYIDVVENVQSVSLFPDGALESPPLDLGEGMFTAMGQDGGVCRDGLCSLWSLQRWDILCEVS